MPVDATDTAPQVPLIETVDWRGKKDLFLNVGSEIEQLHDLRHADSRHPAPASKLRIVPNLLRPHESLKPDGEGHKAGDPRNGVASAFAVKWLLVWSLASTKSNGVCDFLAPAYRQDRGSASGHSVKGFPRWNSRRAAVLR